LLQIILVSGYSTGSIIKEHTQRKEFIEDFYASHPQTSRASVRADICRRQSKRAVSLPSVLEAGNTHTIGQEQRLSHSGKEQAKSNDDLLQL
jgi:hypothetical protein